jgi:hypothetical protein
LPPTFGAVGQLYTIREKLKHYPIGMDLTLDKDESYYDRQKKLPGPGYYNQLETVGRNVVESTYKTSQSNAFSKAHDRWESPTKSKVHPNPASYHINMGSTQSKAAFTKFGQSTADILDQ